MSRYLLVLLVVFLVAAPCCHAQLLKKLEQELMQGQNGQMGNMMSGQPGQPIPAGSTSLPPGQYTMTNVQTGQAYYIMVQNNGQMFLTAQTGQQQGLLGGQQGMMPGQYPMQQNGVGGAIKGRIGNFLKNELAPPQPQQY